MKLLILALAAPFLVGASYAQSCGADCTIVSSTPNCSKSIVANSAQPLSCVTSFGCYSPSADYYTRPYTLYQVDWWECPYGGSVLGNAGTYASPGTGATSGSASGSEMVSFSLLGTNWFISSYFNQYCDGTFDGTNYVQQGGDC